MVVLVLVLTVGIVNVVLPAWSRAQFDAVVAVAITQRTPVIASVARLLTDTPRVDEVVVAGQPTTLARPGGGGPWPAVVFVNGATRQGRYLWGAKIRFAPRESRDLQAGRQFWHPTGPESAAWLRTELMHPTGL